MNIIITNFKEKFLNPKCRRKNIENLVIFLVGVVILIITGSYIFSDDEKEVVSKSTINDIFDANLFEEKLEKILSEIEGAGKVKVMVSYESGIETIPLLDTKDNNVVTEEKGNDTTRRTEENNLERNIIFNHEKSGNKVPYISKTVMPIVEGVIVTCDGGGDEIVKANIIKAVTVITGVTANKVQVFPKNKK